MNNYCDLNHVEEFVDFGQIIALIHTIDRSWFIKFVGPDTV